MSTRIEKSKPLVRKQPSQARSKATVDALVEAAARILSDQGWAGSRPTRWPKPLELALGRTIRYLPDKHSLVEAIRDRHLDNCLVVLKKAIEGEKTLPVFVAELVDGVIAIHSTNPGLHWVLLDEAPSSESFLAIPNSAFKKNISDTTVAAVAKYSTRGGSAADGRVWDDHLRYH